MIIPGIVSATFKTETPDRVLELLKKSGMKAVEWSEKWHVAAGDTVTAAALAEKTGALGLRIAAYGSYYRLGEREKDADGQVTEERIRSDFRPSLDCAAAMQAPLIRIWGGTQPSEALCEADREALAQEAAVVAEMAAEKQVKIALEWHKNTVTDTNASAEDFLDRVERIASGRGNADSNLYCLWQPTVALDLGERTAGIRLLEKRRRLLNLHVYYWLDGVRRPFSEDPGEWEQYLEAVEADTLHYGLLEFVMDDTPEQFLADADCWKERLKRSGLLGE